MQITIVQAEIEEAIKAYVTGQIALKPGQEIDIDLKATRGEQGYQAIINIGFPSASQMTSAQVAQAAPAAPVAPVAPRPVQAQTKVITTADLKRMQAEEAAAEEAAEAAAAGTEEAPVAATEAEAVVVTEEAQPEAAAAPVAASGAKKRLFGGFQKPTNG